MTADLLSRFSQKYVIADTGCWEWTAAKLKFGYGRVREGAEGSKTITAHRASWLLHRGQIGNGLCVCHRCASLKWVDVETIRLHRRNGLRYREIASLMSVPKSTIWNVCNKTWRNHNAAF